MTSPVVAGQVGTAALNALLESAARWHKHLCPRQVLGARIGLAGAAALNMDVPRDDKRLLALVETDGCFVSGVMAATGLSVNRRTLRIVDYGKTAVTFVNVETGGAVRVAPLPTVRDEAACYAPEHARRYFAMLDGYQRMPDERLLRVTPVALATSLVELISRPGVRTTCDHCGEEIINEREVRRDGETLCRWCAGDRYYEHR